MFSGKKRKKSQKCCAFVPTPIYAEGSVFMCVFVYIIQLNTVISAICVCVCMLLRVSMDQVQKVCVVVDILVDRAILLDKSEIK